MDTFTGPFTDNRLGTFVKFPLVQAQITRFDHALDAEFSALDKNAKISQPRNNHIHILTDAFGKHLQEKYCLEFLFGIGSLLFSEGDVLAGLDQFTFGENFLESDLVEFSANIAIDQSMHQQIRITADGAGKVAIMC